MIAIHITLSEEDINKIEKNMEYLNMKNRSAYIRKMATDGRCQVVDPSGLLELNRLMHIAGNNLNQCAKRDNQVGAAINGSDKNTCSSCEKREDRNPKHERQDRLC